MINVKDQIRNKISIKVWDSLRHQITLNVQRQVFRRTRLKINITTLML